MSATPGDTGTLDVLTLDRPEQLKALGHPLRLRVLEMLGEEDGEALTNRELAGADRVSTPGHLHFHVRMLLKAGLIRLAAERRRTPREAVSGGRQAHPRRARVALGRER